MTNPWTRILIGSLLLTAGLLCLVGAVANLHFYYYPGVGTAGIGILDSIALLLILLGVPLLIAGSAFVAKGIKEYLRS
jgi:hypothetical protein